MSLLNWFVLNEWVRVLRCHSNVVCTCRPQSALMLSEVLKEREAQVQLKQRIDGARQDVDKLLLDVQKQKDQEATQEEQETAQRRKLEKQAIAEDLKQK